MTIIGYYIEGYSDSGASCSLGSPPYLPKWTLEEATAKCQIENSLYNGAFKDFKVIPIMEKEKSSMLDLLANYLSNGTIAKLLHDESKWDSLIVNKRKPHTYRVFTNIGENRICLHKFDTCDLHESFLHPHPWSGAFMIVHGSYKMLIGNSKDRFTEPESYNEFVLTEGSMYEISNPLTWHSVTPLETTYTIMINGPSWDVSYAHTKVRTTKGKDLDKMPVDDLVAHLDKFVRYVSNFQ